MKKSDSKKLWAFLTAAVFVLAAVLMLSGCPNAAGGGKPSTGTPSESQNGVPQNQKPAPPSPVPDPPPGPNPVVPEKITLTIQKNLNVESITPDSLKIDKGSTWSAVKGKIRIVYSEGYTDAGWKRDNVDGAYVTDETIFHTDTIVFALARKKDSVAPQKIKVRVSGDENVTVLPPQTFEADHGVVWAKILSAAEGMVGYKAGYEADCWKLDNAAGILLTDTEIFSGDKTVFAVSKAKTDTPYAVEHWKQNIADNEYTKAETENLTGTTGGDTAVIAKNYPGFMLKSPVSQEKIKGDGSTAVKIYYDRKEITLTFHLAGGATTTSLTDGTLKGKFGAPVGINAPTKTGYKFTGWNPSLPSFFPDVNAAYTAQWAPESAYSIIYHLNGGANHDSNPAFYTVETPTINLQNPSKANYTFAGWYDNEGCTTPAVTQIVQGSTGDRNLYAKWTPVSFNITYHLNEGTNHEDNPSNYTIETPTINLQHPSKANYTFAGWYDNEGCTAPAVTQIVQGSTGERNLYAKWTAVRFNITYHLNGGANASVNPKDYTVETPTINLQNPSKANYTFAGWYDNEGCTAPAVTQIVQGSTGERNLYAKWTPVSFNITYHLNEGTNHEDNPSNYTIETPTINLQHPSKANHTFAGWYENSDFSGIPIIRIEKGSAGDKTFYAKWLVNYGIVYHLNGGTENPNPASYTEADLPLTLQPALKTDYDFDGWYDNEDCTGSAVTQIPKGATGKKTFYAKWKTTYRITYHLNGGINHDGNPVSYTAADLPLSLQPASREGYDFQGWFADSGFSGEAVTEIVKGSTGNKNFYAKWNYVLTIRGDERLRVSSPAVVPIVPNQTWASVKSQALGQVSLTSEWQGEDYGVYEWRLNDENGSLLTDEYEFTESTTVYAVTNYKKFLMSRNSITGKWGAQPRGKIIIPARNGETPITEIRNDVFVNCDKITSVRFPSSLITIGENAFRDCTNITGALDLSSLSNLTTIGKSAFSRCTGITSVNFPSSLIAIGDMAFYSCIGLKGTLDLPQNLQTLAGDVFHGCKGLTEVHFPSGLQIIGDGAFYACEGLTELNLPSGLQTIDNDAFNNCTGLTRVHFPSGLTAINEFAFGNCPKLKEISLPQGLTTIGSLAFAMCKGLSRVDLPASLKEIGQNNPFTGCENLTSFTVNPANNYFCTENNVLYNREKTRLIFAPMGITEVTLLSGLEIINGGAFFGCKKLTAVSFPSSLKTIGFAAFGFCTELRQIELPASLTEITQTPFIGCEKLTRITVHSANTAFCAENNIVYTKDKKKLVCAASGLTEVSLPSGLEIIEQGAFQKSSSLTKVIFPDSLTTINADAFQECTGLTEVVLPKNIATIGRFAFYKCTAITKITLPASLTKIVNSAFRGTNLTEAVFEDTQNWKIYWDEECNNSAGNISSSDLGDSAKAALYLRKTHTERTWKKN